MGTLSGRSSPPESTLLIHPGIFILEEAWIYRAAESPVHPHTFHLSRIDRKTPYEAGQLNDTVSIVVVELTFVACTAISGAVWAHSAHDQRHCERRASGFPNAEWADVALNNFGWLTSTVVVIR